MLNESKASPPKRMRVQLLVKWRNKKPGQIVKVTNRVGQFLIDANKAVGIREQFEYKKAVITDYVKR